MPRSLLPAACRRAVALMRGLAILTVAAAALAAEPSPPPAPSVPVTDTLHGVAVADPYRNLENLADPRTRDWLSAQGAHAEAVLSRIAVRDALAARLQVLSQAAGDTVRQLTRMPGDRLYYLRRLAGENQFKLILREGVNGAERVLVDPDALSRARGVPHAINYFKPSWDGRTLAYGISAGGSEDASLQLLDIASGKPVGPSIPRVHEGNLHWTPDSRHLAFNQLRKLPAGAPDTETYLDTTVFLLDRSRPGARPRALFGPLVNRQLGLDRLDVAEVVFSADSRWMFARTTDTTVPEGRLFVAPLAALNAAPKAAPNAAAIPWRAVATAADKITDVQLRGDTLYLRSYAGAPRGRVLALPLADPVLAKARVVVPEPSVGVLDAFMLGPGRTLYTEVSAGFTVRARRHAAEGAGVDAADGQDLAPGVVGSTQLVEDPAHAHAEPWVGTSSWTEPPRVLAVSADGSTRDTGLRRNTRPPGTPELEVTEVLVTSHDGARVPLVILRRQGLPLTGDNPTLLVGYGAYGFSFQAHFDPRSMAWLERGGVLAYANVRGSGAYGDDWYRAGFKATKPNTWKDGIACARWLIAQGYASPATLGVWGTSAGGIFVGRAVTTAPELFAAAIFDVGEMDLIRGEESANGITNTSEFGTTRDAAEFRGLLEMSTYHQIRDGVAYPAVLLVHGLNDPRVDAWHSAKAAARLQATSASGKPVLLRLDGAAGHGVGSTMQQAVGKDADIYSFLLWQFGKAGLRQP